MRTQTASARMQEAVGSYLPPKSSPLQAPAIDPASVQEARPAARLLADRPAMYPPQQRRASNASIASSTLASHMSSHGSFDSRPRSSSMSSQASFDSHYSSHSSGSVSPYASPRPPSAAHHYQLQVGHSLWARPHAIKQYRRKAKPGELFAALPGEVLELILEHLKALHLAPGSTSCATCWMRDCCSVALSARKWLKYARVALYEDIQLNGQESLLMKKRMKGVPSGRLLLLRRTLRSDQQIAVIVHSLKVPTMAPAGSGVEEYYNMVASVIMACPNFERLVGLSPEYDHAFSRLFHALSTRRKLKQMDWVVEPSPFQRQHRIHATGSNLLTPGDLQPFQSASFLDLHHNWQHLTHLVLHCLPGATLTPDTMLATALKGLVSLKNLHVSHLPQTSFNDRSLMALPALRSLTLSHLPGISTAGLSSFATAPAGASIQSLSLIHLEVNSLPALARTFSNLTALQSFTLVQSYPPVMPSDEMIWLFPYLASASLTKLHWDIPYLPTRASAGDVILAKSILANGFPALHSLRAPNDPEGVFQSICRPREKADHASDRYRGATRFDHGRSSNGLPPGHSHSGSVASTGTAAGKSPTSPGFAPDSLMMPREHSDLRQSRLAAQARIENARRFPRFFVDVTDEGGTLVEKFGIGAFIGTVESKINYLLTPDPGATDEGGGLVSMAELLGDCGEDLVLRPKEVKQKDSKRESKKDREVPEQTREGCTGRWNMTHTSPDKKDRDKWTHVERGRWRGVSLF